MSDKAPVVHIGENSPEEVAYKLLHDIMKAERKTLLTGELKQGWTTADRAYLLKTYDACIHCVTLRNYDIASLT